MVLGTGSFEVKIRTNTAKFTKMNKIYREQIFESEVFIEDRTKVASRQSE